MIYKNLDDDGLIPKQTPCPFTQECSMLNERCPTENNLKIHRYSCGAARFLDMRVKKEVKV